MIDPTSVPDVNEEETLARFIFHQSHIRSSNNTVKADAFIPHPHADLSVTRHLSATGPELWNDGFRVSKLVNKTLHGRADFQSENAVAQGLIVKADPIPDNPNHAILIQWPAEKPAQKMIAMELAASAVLLLSSEAALSS